MTDEKKLALERVKILLREAEDVFSHSPQRSHHYVQQARRIAMKVRLKLPRTLRRQFCKHCLHYLKPGVNARVRTRNKMLVVYCHHCKRFQRFVLG